MAITMLTGFTRSEGESDKLTQEDRQALAIGRAVLRLEELAGAGAPWMTAEQEAELERNVKFLSETQASRMTWAWLEFRLKNDSQLQLENNPGAKAIRQRLDLLTKLLRKYFILE
ncbi:MAG: hypothetical protein ABJQ29_16940 [Luteolibacter sp.]